MAVGSQVSVLAAGSQRMQQSALAAGWQWQHLAVAVTRAITRAVTRAISAWTHTHCQSPWGLAGDLGGAARGGPRARAHGSLLL